MKKPLNRFALALWALAVLVLFAMTGEYFSIFSAAHELAQRDTIYVVGHFGKFLVRGAVAAAQLASFGVIIELVDQIRWNAQQK
jgi:heme/copper-type cytochrome/quinol oxidase subunit 1